MPAPNRISTAALTGILAYDPAEMVMTAQAGTPLPEIVAALDDKGQMLAFEPMDPRGVLSSQGEQTIGGVFAVNLSGPRRFVAGAARDAALGMRFVNGAGEAVKAGGRVMKNVTGLDIVKLMTGSHGTLGLITELTFKVLPKPQDCATIVVASAEDDAAVRLMARVMATSLEVSGAAWLPESCRGKFLFGVFKEAGIAAFRIEGLAFSVRERAQKLMDALAGEGSVSQLDAQASAVLWAEIRDAGPFAANPDKPLWRVSVAPSQGAALINALRMQTGVDGYMDWQGGLLWLQMEAEPEAALVRGLVHQLGGGHATLVRATPLQKAEAGVFQPQSPAIAALNQAIRLKFDPRSVFNPGRMI